MADEHAVPNIPPVSELPETVTAIMAFMATYESGEKLYDFIVSRDDLLGNTKVSAGPTAQGRHWFKVEGSIPKEKALDVLRKIDELGGDIQVVAGN